MGAVKHSFSVIQRSKREDLSSKHESHSPGCKWISIFQEKRTVLTDKRRRVSSPATRLKAGVERPACEGRTGSVRSTVFHMLDKIFQDLPLLEQLLCSRSVGSSNKSSSFLPKVLHHGSRSCDTWSQVKSISSWLNRLVLATHSRIESTVSFLLLSFVFSLEFSTN